MVGQEGSSDAAVGVVLVLFAGLAVAGIAFWIWALVDAIRIPDDSLYKSGTKLIWVLVIVLVGWIGAIIYLVVGRPDGGAKAAIARWGSRRDDMPPPGLAIPPPPAP